MIATSFSNIRDRFKEVCDRAVQDCDIAILTQFRDIDGIR